MSTLCDPTDCSTPGFLVHHQLLELTQSHAHWVSDAIQPSHPLSFPSPPTFKLSQHQGVFKWDSSSHQVAKVLEFQLQHHSLQKNPRANLLQNGLVGSLCSPRDSQESSPRPQFKSINSSALSFLSSSLAWKVPWTEEPGGLQPMGSLRVGHDWATSLSLFIFMHWRRRWQPTPVFLPGESQGQGSLVGCGLWGRTELDTTEVT